MNENKPDKAPSVEAEPVVELDPLRLSYLSKNRGIIVKRSLVATAIGGIVPIPVMDDYIAGRVRAGLLIKLAEQRNVDLVTSSAELLGDPPEGSAIRSATLTAISLVAIKFAWRKVFTLLAAGRGAEEMASTFQFATIFDHYCARVHVGGPIDRKTASELRTIIHATVASTEKATLAAVFRDGARILGKSLLEAPAWFGNRLATLAGRWVSTRGNATATFDPAADLGAGEQTQWLDRATRAIDDRLALLGTDYLAILVEGFDRRWAIRPSDAQKPDATPHPPAEAD